MNEHELRIYSVKDLLGLTGPHRHDPRRQKRYRVYYTKMPISVSDLERRYKMRVQMMDEKMQITVWLFSFIKTFVLCESRIAISLKTMYFTSFQETTVFPEKTGTVQSILDEAQREFRFSANGTKLLRRFPTHYLLIF